MRKTTFRVQEEAAARLADRGFSPLHFDPRRGLFIFELSEDQISEVAHLLKEDQVS